MEGALLVTFLCFVSCAKKNSICKSAKFLKTNFLFCTPRLHHLTQENGLNFQLFPKSCSKKLGSLTFFSGGRHRYVSNLNDVKSEKQLLTFDNFFPHPIGYTLGLTLLHTYVGISQSKITSIMSGKTLKRKCINRLQ